MFRGCQQLGPAASGVARELSCSGERSVREDLGPARVSRVGHRAFDSEGPSGCVGSTGCSRAAFDAADDYLSGASKFERRCLRKVVCSGGSTSPNHTTQRNRHSTPGPVRVLPEPEIPSRVRGPRASVRPAALNISFRAAATFRWQLVGTMKSSNP